jgi:hypothetical protein
MAEARTGTIGIVQENPAAEIVEGLSGGSNVLGPESPISAPVEAPVQEQQLPSFPEQNAQYYVPSQQQAETSQPQDQQGRETQADARQQRNVSQQQQQTSATPIRQQQQQQQQDQQLQQQQPQQPEQPAPRSMRDILGVNQDQPLGIQNMEVPAYSGTVPFTDNVDLASGGDQRVSMDRTYDLISNALEDNTFQPTDGGTQLQTQSENISVSNDDVDNEQGISEVARSSQAGVVASKIQNAKDSVGENDVNGTSIDYEPQFNRYDFHDMPTVQFSETQKATKQTTATAVASKSWDGNAFTEKAIADNRVAPCDASIGSFVIREIVREPGNNLISLVNSATGQSFTVDDVLTDTGMNHFADAINVSNIDIVATKSPVVGPADVNARRLRVHYGRGIKVHTTQTKLWNLDFDGDGISISFDLHDGVKNAMNYMINANGQAMVDSDFFPISKITENKDEYVEAFKFFFLQNVSEYVDLTKLANAMYYVSNPQIGLNEDASKYMNNAWCSVLREMKNLSNRFSNPDIAMSGILKNVFDGMRLLKQYDVSDIAAKRTGDVFDNLEGQNAQEEPADEYIRIIVNQMAAGSLPPNFQDFVTGLNQYVGEVEGKNVGFRIGAKYAKVIKASQLTFKGDEESYKLIYRLTLQAGEAMFMSGRSTIGERVAYMQRVAKRRVQAEVGFPNRYKNIREFLSAFKKAYNNEMRVIECSDFGGFSCALDPNPDPDRKIYKINSDKLSDFVTPFVNVYGDYTISTLFPNLSFVDYIPNVSGHSLMDWDTKTLMLLEAYKNMTLREISNNNKINIPSNVNVYRMIEGKNGDKKKEKTKVKFHEAKIQDTYDPSYLLFAIAGKRTAAASKYNKGTLIPLLKNFEKAFTEIRRRYDSRFDNYADYVASMNEIVSALHLSGKAMFDYFQMQDPLSFINSHWGRLINQAIDQSRFGSKDMGFRKFVKGRTEAYDAIGGIRTSMVFEYKMRRVDAVNSEISRLLQSEDLSDIADSNVQTVSKLPRRLNQLQNKLEAEFDALASSSDLWKVLVAEMRDGDNSAFQSLISSEGKIDGFFSDANDGCGFWSDPANRDYNSLTEVIRDPKLSKTVKEQVAVDVVRMFTGFNAFKSYEMNYQLELESDPAYTSINLMAYNEQPSVISEIHEANNMIQRFFNKNWNEALKDVEAAYGRFGDKPGALNGFVETLDENPDAYLEIPNEFIADAIEAQMDKTSRAGEKAHQEIQVDGFFNALMLQRGGLTDAVYRTEARTINMIAEDMLTAYDIIRILAHPEIQLTVYNGDTRYPLSRSILCGDNSEESLWAMLRSNPRIAYLVRSGIISSGNKGKTVYKNAKASFLDSMLGVANDRKVVFKGKVKSMLIDKPMFLSMVAMFVPIHNRASRSVRPEHTDMFDALQLFIVKHAHESLSKTIDIGSILDTELGVSVSSLVSSGMNRNAATRWYQAMCEFLSTYINDVAGILKSEAFSNDDINAIISSYNDAVPSFDLQSIYLAIDCRQTFTGAKTETSTGIEGNITRNHLGTGLYVSQMRGRHEIIDGSMSAVELAPFIGCLTNFGIFDGVNIDELEELSGDEPLIVEAPEGYQKQDATLYEDGYQITTLGRFTSIKRGKAAEEGNLKVKKSGDDGTDSVTKFNRYDEKAAENVGLVERAYQDAEDIPNVNNKLFAAKLKLAQILQKVDNSEGYDDMDLADYMDLADVMIKEVSGQYVENGSEMTGSAIVIRSLGEISAAIRRQMDQAVVENGTPKDIIDAAVQIADQVGMSNPLTNEEAQSLALVAASQIQSDTAVRKFSPMAKPSEGTFERNFGTLSQLMTDRMVRLPWSGKMLSTKDFLGDSKKVYPFSQDKLEARADIVFKDGIDNWDKPKGFNEKAKYGRKKKLFFYCPINVTRSQGISSKKSVTNNISPGPQSVWILEKGASANDIEKAVNACYAFGMTLAFTDTDALGDFKDTFISDVTEAPFGNGYMMIPFFNIVQSGGAINPPMSPATFDIDPSNYSLIFEDSYNFFSLGDAQMLTDSQTANEINCSASGVESLNIGDLFYNVLHDETIDPATGKRVCDTVKDVRLARWDEIRRDIVEYVDDGPSFDLGISVVNPNSENALKKFGLQIQEYRDNFNSVNANGILKSSRPDRIIGWMRCTVGDESKPVYAPIIPFPTGTALSAPTRFEADVSIQDGNPRNSVDVSWRIAESIDGQIVKVHDGSNPAGKSMTMLVSGETLGKLMNGRRIDHVIAAETNSSRKLATEPRMSTMQTLARIAKLDYGFNFANTPNSFPDNRSIRQALQQGYIPIEQWESINKQVIRYSTDPDVDKFVRKLVEKAIETGTTNPTDFLACEFPSVNGRSQRTTRYVDYDFFFEPTDEFENAMLKFYNSMIPELCPPSIDSYNDGVAENGKEYLFKPVDDYSKEFQYGCLQMLQPFPDPDGNGTIWVWNNAYLNLNFYNDEYTGLHKPGANGSHATMEQLAAMAISGYPLAGKDMKLFAEYATSPAYKNYGGYEIHLDRGKFLSRER